MIETEEAPVAANCDTDVLVRVGSRRAAEKLRRILGYRPDDYHVWHTGNYYNYIPADRARECLAITGVSRARRRDDVIKCFAYHQRIPAEYRDPQGRARSDSGG
jgi:hypothetical protein